MTHERIASNLSTATVGEIQKNLSKKTKSMPRNLSLSY